MKNYIFISILILAIFISCKNDESLTSFAQNNKKIEDSNENLNIKNESFLEAIYIQAEKNDDLIERKETAKKIHAIGIDLYKYIADLKRTINEKNSTEFVNELFFNGADITQEGEEFLMYVKNYKDSMNSILGNSNPRIIGMVNNNFDLSVIEDRRGQKTNWLTLNFKDFPPIISITKLSTMQSDIRRIETQYLAELLGVKLDSKVEKIVEQIKTDTNKQISENQTPTDLNERDGIIDSNEISDEPLLKKNEEQSDSNTNTEEDKTANEIIDNESVKDTENVIKEEPKKIVPKKTEPKKIEPQKIKKKTHTVKSGENLYRISLKYKMSPEKIKKLNKMRNNNIVVGQVLKLE